MIEIKNLNKSYGDLRVLNDISVDIKKGENFSEQNIRSVRPGYGLHPQFLKELVGKKAKRDIKFSERLTKEDLI